MLIMTSSLQINKLSMSERERVNEREREREKSENVINQPLDLLHIKKSSI